MLNEQCGIALAVWATSCVDCRFNFLVIKSGAKVEKVN